MLKEHGQIWNKIKYFVQLQANKEGYPFRISTACVRRRKNPLWGANLMALPLSQNTGEEQLLNFTNILHVERILRLVIRSYFDFDSFLDLLWWKPRTLFVEVKTRTLCCWSEKREPYLCWVSREISWQSRTRTRSLPSSCCWFQEESYNTSPGTPGGKYNGYRIQYLCRLWSLSHYPSVNYIL